VLLFYNCFSVYLKYFCKARELHRLLYYMKLIYYYVTLHYYITQSEDD